MVWLKWNITPKITECVRYKRVKTFISLLRGINVSGQKKIRMDELRSLYESLGLGNVQSYLQSGNVVFESKSGDEASLSRQIEAQIEQFYGYSVPVLLREPFDFKRIITGNEFIQDRSEDPARLYVTFLYREPTGQELSNLDNPGIAGEKFIVGEKEIYLFCPNGYGTTKLSNNFFEKKLNIPATTRNWNTVNALYNLATGSSE